MTTPQPSCESSRLTIPNDPRYADVAARYAAEVARLLGFEERAQDGIFKGIREALPALIRYSFETDERASLEVFCERIPAGLKIVIRDKGLPFGDRGPWPADAGAPDNTLLGLPGHFDKIRFNSLGPEGNEAVFVKHQADSSLADYEAACRVQPPDALLATRPVPQAATPCTVRAMEPSEALEISKSVYRTYGYSYPHDYVYYPEKIIALNASGEVHSAVAVTEGNEIVGHCALRLWSDNPQIAVMGQGVVVPKYRSQGCFRGLTEYLIGIARARGLKGIFAEAVTAHPFSQKTALEQGMGECALFLAVVPPTEGWKGLTNLPSPRGSLLVEFKYLHGQPASGIYAPPRHAGMLGAIYANLNAGAVPRVLPPPGGVEPGGDSTYHIHLIPSLKFARIRIDRFGSNIVADIRHKLRELCLQRWDIIHLILNLSDPRTPLFCPRFEELGFFFAGVLPLGLPSGDALILQYLNTCCADYGAIQTAGRFAPDLVAYVKACDPDPTASQGG